MAVDDLPGPVVNLLNVIGVPWPYINEDTITQFATLTRQFGQAVQNTHNDATSAVDAMADAYRGASSQAMRNGWTSLSAQHVDELVTGCRILADALDVAAGYIVAQKVEALATLVGMAIAFAADQAASVATLGLAEAAVPVIIEGAERIVKSLAMDIQQHIASQVIEAAAKPLIDKVEKALAGLDWSNSDGGDHGPGTSFTLDPVAMRAQIATLRSHADAIRTHGQTYQQGLRGLSF